MPRCLHGHMDLRGKPSVLDGIGISTCTVEQARLFVQRDAHAYMILSRENKCDPEVYKTSVAANGQLAYWFPRGDEFRMTENMWLAALKSSDQLVADPPLSIPAHWTTPDFYLTKGLEANGAIIKHFPPKVRENRVYAMRAVLSNPHAFSFVATTFSDDKDMVLAALEVGWMLKYASLRLQDDEEVVRRAIRSCVLRKDGDALQYASLRFRRDKNLVLTMCRAYPRSYEFCVMQEDPKVACAALANGTGLSHFLEGVRRTNLLHYTAGLIAEHAAFHLLDFGARAARGLFNPAWRTGAAIAKLYDHGPHFALLFKKKIFAFLMGELTFCEAKRAALALHTEETLRPNKRKSE